MKPWKNSDFAPLPRIVLDSLSNLCRDQMPNRNSFDETLSQVLCQMMPEISQTSAFPPDKYIKIYQYIQTGESNLPPRLQSWASHHHIRLGSERFILLLQPKDATFNIGELREEKMRRNYMVYIDGEAEGHSSNQPYDKDFAEHDLDAFDRLPVQPQIYDVLAYAHGGHATTTSMLLKVREMGIASITWPMADIFVRQCPVCNPANKKPPASAETQLVHN